MSNPLRRRAGRALVGAAALALLSVLGACAGVPKDAGFADVRKTAAAALQKDVQWNKGTAQDAAASKAVRSLLERPLSADDAVQIALLNNPGLQAAYEDLGIAQADLVQAGLLANPVFSADVFAFGDGSKETFSVVQDFLGVVTLAGRKQVAASQFERRKYEIESRIMDLAAAVRTAYYKALADEQSLGLFKQVASATEAAADLAERQRAAGNMTPRDQAMQQLFYAQTLLDGSRFETQLASDREALNRLLGLWGRDVAWNLPARLGDVPEGMPAIETLESLAVSRRADLAAAKQSLETAGYALDLGENYRYLSMLGLGLGLERETDGSAMYGPVLEFGLPLFDQGQAKIAVLESQRRQRAKLLTELGVEIRSQVREAWTRMIAAHDAVRHYETALLPLNRRIVGENQRLYNGMLIGPYELLQSKQNELNAWRDYVAAVRDYWIARSDLERALGGPLPGVQSARADADRAAAASKGPQDGHQHVNSEN